MERRKGCSAGTGDYLEMNRLSQTNNSYLEEFPILRMGNISPMSKVQEVKRESTLMLRVHLKEKLENQLHKATLKILVLWLSFMKQFLFRLRSYKYLSSNIY